MGRDEQLIIELLSLSKNKIGWTTSSTSMNTRRGIKINRIPVFELTVEWGLCNYSI